LGDFLNMPVRYYSAGMMVRLAFSIATAIEPEILIVDEVLSAGDMAFQVKARERMRALMSTARAVIVVSHDLTALQLLCDRVMWLDHGRVRLVGSTEEVIAAYTQQVNQDAQRQAA
jgi:ABC-type polysaccharide/polyol phosphate transport system ATPase subunit